MDGTKFKVESGIQLLSRLTAKKTKIENFYPNLFGSGPKYGDIIEIFSNRSSSFLLIDIICEALLPMELGGAESGVLILNTDGHITLQALTALLQLKLLSRRKFNSNIECTEMLKQVLDNLYIQDIFDDFQLNTTLQKLDYVLAQHNNISLCIIDTFTAFYWSEHRFKMVKMDSYLKKLLRVLQKSTKSHEIAIIYTRPDYFNSSKDQRDNLEACCENPTVEKINCRVELLFNEDKTWTANISLFNNNSKRNFRYVHNQIYW
ncbi:DNA repair protein XRCC2-like [Choristoneura fumiferana]|uniref:DNA repair protein XRCC2-like n=1 Tax=Choristoneura fumiferana TaxID=7141 RepID=UPI003D15B34B